MCDWFSGLGSKSAYRTLFVTPPVGLTLISNNNYSPGLKFESTKVSPHKLRRELGIAMVTSISKGQSNWIWKHLDSPSDTKRRDWPKPIQWIKDLETIKIELPFRKDDKMYNYLWVHQRYTRRNAMQFLRLKTMPVRILLEVNSKGE